MAYAMVVAGVGAVVGGIMGSSAAKAANREKRRQVKAQRAAAVQQYSAIEHSVDLMKAANKENAMNAVGEVLRDASSEKRKGNLLVDKAASTTQAQSEGLTSGKSKGRQMADVYSRGAKAMLELKSKETTMIGGITDMMDKNTNDLTNKKIGAWNKMASILKQEHPAAVDPTQAMIGGAITGAQTGMSLASSFSSFTSGGDSVEL